MRRAMWLLAPVAVLVLAATAGSAPADRAVLEDADDVPGPMDVRRVWFDAEARPPLWTVVTYLDWRPRQIRDRGFVVVFLDTIGGERADYYVLIRSTGTELSGSLWRDPRRGQDVRVRSVRVERTTPSNVRVSLRVGTLDIGRFRSVYRWSVVTLFTGAKCRATCIDALPDEGAVEQPLPGASPTPTSTPTPTPTPSPTISSSPTPSPSAS